MPITLARNILQHDDLWKKPNNWADGSPCSVIGRGGRGRHACFLALHDRAAAAARVRFQCELRQVAVNIDFLIRCSRESGWSGSSASHRPGRRHRQCTALWPHQSRVGPSFPPDPQLLCTEFPIPSFMEVFGLRFRELPRLVGRYCS